MIDTGLRNAQRLQRTSVGLVTIPPFTMELLMHHARRPSHIISLQSFARPPPQRPSSSSGKVRLTTLLVDQFRHHGYYSSGLLQKTQYAGVMPVFTACHWLPATEMATESLSPFAEPANSFNPVQSAEKISWYLLPVLLSVPVWLEFVRGWVVLEISSTEIACYLHQTDRGNI